MEGDGMMNAIIDETTDRDTGVLKRESWDLIP